MIKADVMYELVRLSRGHSSDMTMTKEKLNIFHKIVQMAMLGHSEFIYKVDEPLTDHTIKYFKDLGYNITLDGFKYRIDY
jgi:hypothetical protein